MQWLLAHQPCSDHAFIAKIPNAYVSDNRVNAEVPGTVFTDDNVYLWQVWMC